MKIAIFVVLCLCIYCTKCTNAEDENFIRHILNFVNDWDDWQQNSSNDTLKRKQRNVIISEDSPDDYEHNCRHEGDITIESSEYKSYRICKYIDKKLKSMEVRCKKGTFVSRKTGECFPLPGNGEVIKVFENDECPNKNDLLIKHPVKQMYRNYLICLPNLIISAKCNVNDYFDIKMKRCRKNTLNRQTIVKYVDEVCRNVPLVLCKKPGVNAIFELSNRRKTYKVSNDINCYYLCKDISEKIFELRISLLQRQFEELEEQPSSRMDDLDLYDKIFKQEDDIKNFNDKSGRNKGMVQLRVFDNKDESSEEDEKSAESKSDESSSSYEDKFLPYAKKSKPNNRSKDIDRSDARNKAGNKDVSSQSNEFNDSEEGDFDLRGSKKQNPLTSRKQHKKQKNSGSPSDKSTSQDNSSQSNEDISESEQDFDKKKNHKPKLKSTQLQNRRKKTYEYRTYTSEEDQHQINTNTNFSDEDEDINVPKRRRPQSDNNKKLPNDSLLDDVEYKQKATIDKNSKLPRYPNKKRKNSTSDESDYLDNSSDSEEPIAKWNRNKPRINIGKKYNNKDGEIELSGEVQVKNPNVDKKRRKSNENNWKDKSISNSSSNESASIGLDDRNIKRRKNNKNTSDEVLPINDNKKKKPSQGSDESVSDEYDNSNVKIRKPFKNSWNKEQVDKNSKRKPISYETTKEDESHENNPKWQPNTKPKKSSEEDWTDEDNSEVEKYPKYNNSPKDRNDKLHRSNQRPYSGSQKSKNRNYNPYNKQKAALSVEESDSEASPDDKSDDDITKNKSPKNNKKSFSIMPSEQSKYGSESLENRSDNPKYNKRRPNKKPKWKEVFDIGDDLSSHSISSENSQEQGNNPKITNGKGKTNKNPKNDNISSDESIEIDIRPSKIDTKPSRRNYFNRKANVHDSNERHTHAIDDKRNKYYEDNHSGRDNKEIVSNAKARKPHNNWKDDKSLDSSDSSEEQASNESADSQDYKSKTRRPFHRHSKKIKPENKTNKKPSPWQIEDNRMKTPTDYNSSTSEISRSTEDEDDMNSWQPRIKLGSSPKQSTGTKVDGGIEYGRDFDGPKRPKSDKSRNKGISVEANVDIDIGGSNENPHTHGKANRKPKQNRTREKIHDPNHKHNNKHGHLDHENKYSLEEHILPNATIDCYFQHKGQPCLREGIFRLHGSCTHYFKCAFNVKCKNFLPSEIKRCAKCLKFNAKDQTCDLPENVPECSYLRNERIPKQEQCTDVGTYSIPNDCQRFYQCRLSRSGIIARTVRTCPKVQTFNKWTGNCELGDHCSHVDTSNCNGNREFIENNHDCNQFFRCNQTEQIPLFCPLNEIFNGEYCQQHQYSDLTQQSPFKLSFAKI